MTLLPWVWFVVGTLVGSGLLVAFALVGAKFCPRASGRVWVFRFALLGLLGIPLVQLSGWLPQRELDGGRQLVAAHSPSDSATIHRPHLEVPAVGAVRAAGWPAACSCDGDSD